MNEQAKILLVKINSIWNYYESSITQQVIEDLMDLDYPSEKKNDLSRQLNHVDRHYGSDILSNPKIIQSSKPICKKIKKKIFNIIYSDKHIKLILLLEKQQISLCDQISKEGHGWNILHYIAKNNSQKCMQLCLRWLYQKDSGNYEQIINRKNCEGDTPLITACMYKSNAVLKILLEYGGIDLYVMNSKKLTAYQIALNLVNEQALQMLMKYQLKIKRKNVINKQALKVPLPDMKGKTCQKFYDWFIDCLYFGNFSSEIEPIKDKDTETDRKMVKKDQAQQQISNIQVVWLQPQKVYERKLPLFSSISQPFSIKQSNIIVGHQLLIFQVLAEHPELLKRVIYNVQDKYYVKLQNKNQEKVVWVDGLFPFFQDTKQPLFLSLSDQLWPMVLQKALCQYYKGYFQSAKIPLSEIIQTITGNQTYTLSLKIQENPKQRSQLQTKLLKIQSKNCLLILTPSQNSPLKPEEGRLQCFSLLKILNDKFLINCPFIYTDLKRYEQRYTRQMKLHQAHYNNPSCTTIWLDSSQFFQIFASAIFCRTLNTSLRANTIKITTSNRRAYMTLKIRQYSENDKLYISIKNKFGDSISPMKCVGWNIIGTQREHVEKVNSQILGNVQISEISMPSQILIMCQFDQKIQNSASVITATCRCQQPTIIQALDCTIGDLQFIECCKKYFKQNYEQYETPIIQTIGDFVLAMAANSQPCYIPLPDSLSQDNIVEGIFTKSESKLQMFKYENIYFAVLSHVEFQIVKNLKIMSYSQEAESQKSEKSQDVSTFQVQSV